MKSILILLALVGFSYELNFQKIVKDFEDAIEKEAKDCYGEFNLNRASLDAKLNLPELPNDRDFKCFFNCVLTHLNIFDKDGNVVENALRKSLDVDQDLENKIYDNCKNIQAADGCEKFYEMAICARKYLK